MIQLSLSYTLKRANSDKLTHYSFLLALSEIFSLSIEDLVNIERIKP